MNAMWRACSVAAALALVAAACGGGDDDGGAGGTAQTGEPGATPGAVTFAIAIDGRPDDFATTLSAFFPTQVQAHPGDILEFTSRFGGEPHTVAFGRLVDEALNGLAAVPAGSPRPDNVRAALAKLPDFFDNEAPVLPLSQPLPAGAQPCFVATGDPPTREPCADQRQPPAFTGTESIYASGFLPDEATFTVTLADDIAPGTYRFMDLVQGAGMSGLVTVVDAATPIPSPAEVAERGRSEFEALVAQLRPAADQIRSATSPQATVGTKVEGVTVPHEVNVFPEEITIGVGESVTWTVTTAHTIAFNAPEDARPLYLPDPQNGAVANRKGADPVGGPGQPVPDPAAPATGTPVLVDGGSFDGQGFRSSGLLVSVGDPVEYRLTFTTPGTYRYRCNFHLDMEGTVKVG